MSDLPTIDPNHAAKRQFLRVAGPAILGVGLLLTICGFVSLITSSGFDGPHYAWLPFIGMPLMFVGGVLSMFGYIGSMARYQSAEITPVGIDTFNTVVPGVRDGVRQIAASIAQGLSDPQRASNCAHCKTLNDSDARFCKSCGQGIAR